MIDVVWDKKDIYFHVLIILSIWDWIGYHSYFIIVLPYKTLIGEPILKVIGLQGRCLQCSVPNVREKRQKCLEERFHEHIMGFKTDYSYMD